MEKEDVKIGMMVELTESYSSLSKGEVYKVLKCQGEGSSCFIVEHDGDESYLAPYCANFKPYQDENIKTKENVFVKINSNKEANNARRVLEALGETSFGNDYSEYSIGLYFNNNLQRWCFATSFGKLVYIEVTLKELIEIIVREKPKTEDKPKELEVGKWYWLKSYFDIKALIFFNGYGEAYGFNHYGKWCNNYNADNSIIDYNPTLATEQKVFEALKNEAVKRGFKEGVTVAQINEYNVGNGGVNGFKLDNIDFSFHNGCLYKNNVMLFQNGKWAEIIEEVNIELNNGGKAIVHKVGQVNFEKPRHFLIESDIDLIKEAINKLK